MDTQTLAPPLGFAPHDRKSPVTDPWEPIYSRKAQGAVVLDTPPPVVTDPPPMQSTARTLEEAEIEMMRSVLEACGGNISEAAKRLGVSRNTIYRRLRWGRSVT